MKKGGKEKKRERKNCAIKRVFKQVPRLNDCVTSKEMGERQVGGKLIAQQIFVSLVEENIAEFSSPGFPFRLLLLLLG